MLNQYAPELAAIREFRDSIDASIVRTPVVEVPALSAASGARVSAKLEFLQQTGTFKARGALAVIRALDDAQRAAGITAVSAGNHAIAAAFAARESDVDAKLVMLATASPLRVEKCREFGAELVMAPDVHRAFELVEEIQRDEGRVFVHPFEGPRTFLGTATVGLEMCEQAADAEAFIVPIGGGGLCAGIASAIKQMRPDALVLGVEPVGADTMTRSIEKGEACGIDKVDTIADSLGAPFALPMGYSLCRDYVDDIVLVSDDEMRAAMRFLFREMHTAVEPACAASTAALLGPLRDRLQGKNVVTLMCGSNVDWDTFARHSGILDS